jgi:hypothetical protein
MTYDENVAMCAAHLLAAIAGDDEAARRSAKHFAEAVRIKVGRNDAGPLDDVRAVRMAVTARVAELFSTTLAERMERAVFADEPGPERLRFQISPRQSQN